MTPVDASEYSRQSIWAHITLDRTPAHEGGGFSLQYLARSPHWCFRGPIPIHLAEGGSAGVGLQPQRTLTPP
jgi:hypothetical protein